MKVIIKKRCMPAGYKEIVEPGTELDLDEKTAMLFCRFGSAVPVDKTIKVNVIEDVPAFFASLRKEQNITPTPDPIEALTEKVNALTALVADKLELTEVERGKVGLGDKART